MARSAPALVKPDLLRWARETAGLPIYVAAKRLPVKAERLASWEAGEGRPTVAQVRKLASVYKRPFAAFYLPEPPAPLPLLRDFRRPSTAARPQSQALRLAHRQARYRRETALELLDELGEEPPRFAVSLAADQPPEAAGAELRSQLGVSPDAHREWVDYYDALSFWRDACESAGSLVCQAPDVDQDEMSGFSISELPLPVIVVNVRDLPRRRIFTMLHEMVHLATRQGGLCEADERPGRGGHEQRIEVLCNQTAAAALVPLELLHEDGVVATHAPGTVWSDAEVRQLAAHFRVSREVTLRRLLTAGLTTPEFYSQKREEFLEDYREMERTTSGGPVPQHKKAIARTGRHFAELVLRAYHSERITTSDVGEYLGLRIKHLPKLQAELLGSGRRDRST